MDVIHPGPGWTLLIIPKSMLQQEDRAGDVFHAEARGKGVIEHRRPEGLCLHHHRLRG